MKKIRIAVLISGTGRSLKNMIERIVDGTLSAEISIVISSTDKAKGLQYAEMNGLPISIVDRIDFPSEDAFSEAVFEACRKARVDFVVMAGYLKLLRIPIDFQNRVINIHPSLVPAFSGKGYYGQRVHDAALRYGVKVSGCSVHFVDNVYDHGPVILQKVVDVLEDDTADSLNDRVFAAECVAYPEALQLIAAGRVSVSDRKVRIAPDPDDDEYY